MTTPALGRAVALSLLVGTAAAAAPGFPIIEDDYAAARLEATQRKLPIFVEVWAPW